MNGTFIPAIIGGCVSALLSATMVSGSFLALILAYLAPLPLFLVGLSLGGRLAAIAGASGFVLTTLLAGPLSGLVFGAMNAIPAWIAIRLLLLVRQTPDGTPSWFPFGGVLAALSGCAGVMLIAGSLFFSSSVNGIEQVVKTYLSDAFAVMAHDLPVESRMDLVEWVTALFPAAIMVSWMVMTLANMGLAQGILKRSDRAIRSRFGLDDISLPDWVSWVLVAAAVVALLSDGDFRFVTRNLTIVLASPFFVVGVATMHSLINQSKGRGALLVAFYGLLFFVFGYTALAVTGLGLVEQWVGLRRRFADKDELPGD